jgi:hypothetical protein
VGRENSRVDLNHGTRTHVTTKYTEVQIDVCCKPTFFGISAYIDTVMVFAKLRAFNNDTPSPPKTSERRDRKWRTPLGLENALLLKTESC